MITAGHPDTTLDEVARFGGSSSAVLIQTTQAAVRSNDTLVGDAPVAAFAGAFLGCLTTLCFSASGIVPDIASALATAVLCSLLLATRTTSLVAADFFPALYGGTFAGMTPIAWLSDSATGPSAASTGAMFITLLSIVCGLAFFAVARLDTRSAAPIGVGCGGRLGAIATAASFLFVELVGSLSGNADRFHSVEAGAFDIEPWSAILGLLVCLVGIFGTSFALRQRRIADGGVPGRILIASAAALSGLLILHLGNPDDAHTSDAFYAGCFLGMSTLDRMKGWRQPVFGAVVLIVVLVPVRAFLHGFGGGLGLAAFVTAMLLMAFGRATAWTTHDTLTRDKSLGTAMAGALIAGFVMVGFIVANRLAEEVPVAVAATALKPIALEPVAELSDATLVRLVVDKASPGTVDDPIPLGVSLINADDDDVVVLSGLPPGSSMTNGRPSATGGWHLSARELADAAIRPAQGFVGGADVTVELQRGDHTIIGGQALHLEWSGPAPRATTDVEPALATGQLPDAVTHDRAAVFRELPPSRSRAAPGARRQLRPPADIGVHTARPARGGQTAAAAKNALQARQARQIPLLATP